MIKISNDAISLSLVWSWRDFIYVKQFAFTEIGRKAITIFYLRRWCKRRNFVHAESVLYGSHNSILNTQEK